MNNPTQTNETLMSLAAKLTEAQHRAIISGEARLTGGYYGLAYFDPPLAEPVGVNHPVFGSHYQLNDLGCAIRDALKARAHSERTGCEQ